MGEMTDNFDHTTFPLG